MSITTVVRPRPPSVSNGADNFNVSDQVTVRQVIFRNQFPMNVAGNLFIPSRPNEGRT